MKRLTDRTVTARRLAIVSAALLGTALTPLPALAQNGTWSGPGTNYNDPNNWNPTGVPTNQTTFGATGPVAVDITASTTLGQIEFNAAAQQYAISNLPGQTLTVNGIGTAGITNLSAFAQTLRNRGTVIFNNSAQVDGVTAGINLINSDAVAGGAATLTFNGTSGLFGTASVSNYGGNASAVGVTATSGTATLVFNDSSSADGVAFQNNGGTGFAVAAVATPATAFGGTASFTFNDTSHADNATIVNAGGAAIAGAGATAAGTANAFGGVASLIFNDTSHADGATITNVDGAATAGGGVDNAAGTAIGGIATVAFNDASHADNATINSGSGVAVAFGGVGLAGTPGDTGTNGGTGTAVGGLASVSFNDTSHADGATISNFGGGATSIGGIGGNGNTGAGGTGGTSVAVGGVAVITFSDSSHAIGATFVNTGAAVNAIGGNGGDGGTAGVGGSGNTALAVGGANLISFQGTSTASGSTFTNTASSAFANGGTGGTGGSGAAGGNGAGAQAAGGAVTLSFSGSSTLGTGSTIVNQGGNAIAIGGDGGLGGTGAAGTGGLGGTANATGGTATVTFANNASAGNALITNTAGTASIITGSGGNGDVGAGGNGGTATAVGGAAQIVFNNNATAANATIINNAGTQVTATAGADGTPGAGGGAGGTSGNGGVSFIDASVIFNDSATGGSAKITNNGGDTSFFDTSVFGTAAGALITNNLGGLTEFFETSSLGSGAVVNNTGSSVNFSGDSTAGTGTITNNNGGGSFFSGNATAGAATINNLAGGFAGFTDTSSAGTAIINNAGILDFSADADAVAARVISSPGGLLDIASTNGGLRLGSLSGSGGTVELGANALQVGYLDLNETFGGVIQGTGQIVKRGTGTLVLTGTNTYNGGTTIEAGALQIGNGGTTGSVNGNIVDNAALIFNRSDTLGYAGVVSGTGSLTKTGAGTLILTGANTYIGGTTINQGILQIGAGGTTGSIVGNVLNNANLTFNRSDIVAFNGVISGTGSLTKTGAGTLVLTGASTYSGGTTISNGALQIGNAGTTGSIIGNVVDNGFLIFNRTDNIIFGGDISGTGNLTKLAAGTLTLTGTNTYSGLTLVSQGALQIGNGGTTGSVSSNILNNAIVAFNRSDVITYGGVISGTGLVSQSGTGTLVLTGVNTYGGGTLVSNGTLQLNGSVASAVQVLASGRLTGTGAVNGNLIASGVVAPGSTAAPLGTLTVTGSATFNAGSFLAPTITTGGATSFLQAGSLTLNGGQVRPTAQAGGLFLLQTDYRIANGTGGRTGTFTGVDESQLPGFLDATLNYVGNDVFLRVRRNATNFAQTAGLTPNQNAVSTALDTAVAANNPAAFTTYLNLYNALLLSPNAAILQENLDTISGDALTAAPIAAQDAAKRFGDRLATNTWSNSSNLWGLASFAEQDTGSDGNGPGYDANGTEFQLGFNTSLGANTRLGLSVGLGNSDVDVDARLATGEVETWSVGAHLRHDFGGLYLAGQFTYNWHSIDSSRALLIAGTANADYDAQTWTASGEAGAVLAWGRYSVEPHVTIRHASTDQDGYTETGPVGALAVAATEYETTRIGVGLRFANRTPASSVRPWASISYERELGDDFSVLDNTLPGLPTFRVLSTELGKDIFTAGLGIEARIGGNLTFFASGSGRWRDNQDSLQFNAGMRIAF